MAIGFVLINTMAGFEHDIRSALDNIEMVSGRWMLFGEYDLIAKIQADDEAELTRCIVEQVRMIPGIKDTKTLIGTEL
ncbi:MAG: AsnC family transcriptional regulator [Euryarchaeota archaeon]|nr:AsnC family transcriptional regulator [Euryarchaeota archaeon]